MQWRALLLNPADHLGQSLLGACDLGSQCGLVPGLCVEIETDHQSLSGIVGAACLRQSLFIEQTLRNDVGPMHLGNCRMPEGCNPPKHFISQFLTNCDAALHPPLPDHHHTLQAKAILPLLHLGRDGLYIVYFPFDHLHGNEGNPPRCKAGRS